MPSADSGWGRLMGEILVEISRLAASHLQLARQEARDQGRVAFHALFLVAGGLLLAQVALLLVTAALALVAGFWLDSLALGFILASLLPLVLAAICLGVGLRRLRRLRPMEETLAELKESRKWLQEDLVPRVTRSADN